MDIYKRLGLFLVLFYLITSSTINYATGKQTIFYILLMWVRKDLEFT
jgi:hypothetical protein